MKILDIIKLNNTRPLQEEDIVRVIDKTSSFYGWIGILVEVWDKKRVYVEFSIGRMLTFIDCLEHL